MSHQKVNSCIRCLKDPEYHAESNDVSDQNPNHQDTTYHHKKPAIKHLFLSKIN